MVAGAGSSTGFRTGRKSIWSACANLAAVRKDMLTSPESTFVTYGRETFIRFASAVCERPRAFIRRISFLRNAEPILSTAFTVNSVTDLFPLCQGDIGTTEPSDARCFDGPRKFFHTA